MTPSVSPHPWSEESLMSKAVLYVERMESHAPDDPLFGLWSVLALELLARAALAHTSPALLADGSSWKNVAFALNVSTTAKKVSQVSIGAKEVLSRLTELSPAFPDEVAGFCVEHIGRRNAELHTGELVFDSLGTAAWLPKYYRACDELLKCMSRRLDELVTDTAGAADMIAALEDATSKAVAKDIHAHTQTWAAKSESERQVATAAATVWATREGGHRANCPACTSPALIQGTPSGPVATEFREDEVIQRQSMLPSSFACIACELRITGLSRLTACGLGGVFSARTMHSISDYYGLYTEDDLDRIRSAIEMEPDFND